MYSLSLGILWFHVYIFGMKGGRSGPPGPPPPKSASALVNIKNTNFYVGACSLLLILCALY